MSKTRAHHAIRNSLAAKDTKSMYRRLAYLTCGERRLLTIPGQLCGLVNILIMVHTCRTPTPTQPNFATRLNARCVEFVGLCVYNGRCHLCGKVGWYILGTGHRKGLGLPAYAPGKYSMTRASKQKPSVLCCSQLRINFSLCHLSVVD